MASRRKSFSAKRSAKEDPTKGISNEDLNIIVSKANDELKQYLAENNVGLARRAAYFLQMAEETLEIQISEDVKEDIERSEEIQKHWVAQLKESDLADFFSPIENKWFAVKIMQIRQSTNEILIHYQGWESKFDQWFEAYLDLQFLPPFSMIQSSKKKKETKVGKVQSAIESTAEVTEGKSLEKEADLADSVVLSERRCKRDVSFSVPREKKVKDKSSKPEKDHNDWYCTNCGMLEAVNGTDLILCDGLCRRSFHLECLSESELAIYNSSIANQENDSKYFCEQCRTSRHSCFICSKEGTDFLEVVRCSQGHCGKYYHLSCVKMENPTFLTPTFSKPNKKILDGDEVVKFIENCGGLLSTSLKNKTADASFPASSIHILPDRKRIEITNFVSFRCPRHYCDTCFEFHGAVDASDLCHCHYCPRAFHTNCIPPASRFNSVCMVCPLHPNELLPGDASLLQRSSQAKTTSSETNGRKSTSYMTKSEGNDGDPFAIQAQIVSFFEQLIIPDTVPDMNNILDNHYRLPLYVKNEVDSIPPTFEIISRNNWDGFPDSKIPPLVIPDSGCDCRDRCDSNCFNFITRVECCGMKCRDKENPTLCHVGRKDCGNRALQSREYAKTKVFQEGFMGLGLKADEFVPAGRLVIEYLGEIIDEQEMIRRMENQRILTPSDKEYYIMELYDGVYVDGKKQGNVSRYINHSCNPNCELQRWNVQGKIRIGIVAIRDIAEGEALSYDYQFDTQQADVFKCYCGSHNCRGTMAPKRDRRAQLEKLLQRRSTTSQLVTVQQNSSASSFAANLNNNGNNNNNNVNVKSAETGGSSSDKCAGSGGSGDKQGGGLPLSKSTSIASSMENGSNGDVKQSSSSDADVSAPTGSSTDNLSSTTMWMLSTPFVESAEERELRSQLVREARDKEKNRSAEESYKEEMSRSYVSKFLPGDAISEIKQGPPKSAFAYARRHGLFLVRNVRPNRSQQTQGSSMRFLFSSRQEKLLARAQSLMANHATTPMGKRKTRKLSNSSANAVDDAGVATKNEDISSGSMVTDASVKNSSSSIQPILDMLLERLVAKKNDCVATNEVDGDDVAVSVGRQQPRNRNHGQQQPPQLKANGVKKMRPEKKSDVVATAGTAVGKKRMSKGTMDTDSDCDDVENLDKKRKSQQQSATSSGMDESPTKRKRMETSLSTM